MYLLTVNKWPQNRSGDDFAVRLFTIWNSAVAGSTIVADYLPNAAKFWRRAFRTAVVSSARRRNGNLGFHKFKQSAIKKTFDFEIENYLKTFPTSPSQYSVDGSIPTTSLLFADSFSSSLFSTSSSRFENPCVKRANGTSSVVRELAIAYKFMLKIWERSDILSLNEVWSIAD